MHSSYSSLSFPLADTCVYLRLPARLSSRPHTHLNHTHSLLHPHFPLIHVHLHSLFNHTHLHHLHLLHLTHAHLQPQSQLSPKWALTPTHPLTLDIHLQLITYPPTQPSLTVSLGHLRATMQSRAMHMFLMILLPFYYSQLLRNNCLVLSIV